MNFDRESFYPSITENAFQEAMNFAEERVDISNTELPIVTQVRKTLLFDDKIAWLKLSENKKFNVPMGSCDSADF